MKDFAGKVAVVTGAASGMGLAFAHKFADEGMSVVLADIESEPLAMAEAALKAKGGKVLAVRTNVMHEDEINKLADTAFSSFGLSVFADTLATCTLRVFPSRSTSATTGILPTAPRPA